MGTRIGIEVSLAVSEAVRLANADVVAAYPITPQTHIVEHLSELIADGRLDAEFVCVESEHSAMSACCGSSAAGARTFTSTAAQGLALMHEILYIASAMRLPIVMATANRALSGPLSIWNDHSDIMGSRDCGWIMLFGENGQEVFDLSIIAFRIAEDRRVLLPTMVNLDGFSVTHVTEPIEFVEQADVDRYLPPYRPVHTLHPDKPVTMGAFGMPEIYFEAKVAQERALQGSLPVIEQAFDEWAALTGRRFLPVHPYRADDAEVLFFGMGGICETATVGIDLLRERGVRAGLLSLKIYRPFPADAVAAAIGRTREVIVIDRAISHGAVTGPVCQELSALVHHRGLPVRLHDAVMGIGGRDVPPEQFVELYDRIETDKKSGATQPTYLIGVRE